MMNKSIIPLGIVSVSETQKRYVNYVLGTHRLSRGVFTEEFERHLCQLHHVNRAVFMASGTCALEVLLKAAKEKYDWPDGSEVIIPATTFIASMSVVRMAGMVPVLCDVEPDTFNLDPEQIEQCVTHRTVAILAVHLLGRAANMPAIMLEAGRLGLEVLEDCCEAVGVTAPDGTAVGSFGTGGAISTYVCHHICTGVGGAVLTNDDAIAKLSASLMQHGRDPSYLKLEDDDNLTGAEMRSMMQSRFWFERWGHSYRLTEMEAALGCGFIETDFYEDLSIRNRVAQSIGRELQPWQDRIAPQVFPEGSNPLFYPFVMKDEESCNGLSLAFEETGIETRPLMPLISQPVVRKQIWPGQFPVAEDLVKRAFLIGCHSGIYENHIHYMRDVCHKYFGTGK